MRKLVFILFLFPCLLFGQNKTIDSLKLALKNAKHDTTLCNILSLLAQTASDKEWPAFNEQLLKLSEKGLVATKEPSTKIKRFYLSHLGMAFSNQAFLEQQRGNIPKALIYNLKNLKIQSEIGSKDGVAAAFLNIGIIYYHRGDHAKGLDYYQRGLKLAEEINDKDLIAYALENIAISYQNQGNLTQALECYYKILKIREDIKFKMGIAASFNKIG